MPPTMLGDHGLTHKGCRFYEGAEVPLLICWPKHFRAGLPATGLAELTDVVPTLLDALEIAKPDYLQGKSLIGILEDRSTPSRHKQFVRSEYHDALDLPGHSHANVIRDERYKLVVYHNRGLGELYDLQEDPDEFRDLWNSSEHATVKWRMVEALLDATMLATDPGQPRVGPM